MSNPFLDGSLAQEAKDHIESFVARRGSVSSEELRHGREIIRNAGVEVGDVVTVSWKVDDEHGGGKESHTGEVAELHDFISVKPDLVLPITALHHIHIERRGERPAVVNPVVIENPFMVASPTLVNPFMS